MNPMGPFDYRGLFVKDFTVRRLLPLIGLQFELVQGCGDDHEIDFAFATLARNKSRRAHGRTRITILRQP